MKRTWDIEELIEHFTLVSVDFDLLANKTGVTRLGFALLLKCFQYEGHFPAAKQDIPRVVVDYVASQLRLEASLYAQYDWTGRTITNHRTQIRDHFGFRDATSADFDEMTAWLIATGKAASVQMERLKETVYAQFRLLHLAPPTPERVEQLIRSACSSYEQTFFLNTFQQLSPSTRERLDALLTRGIQSDEQQESSPHEEEEDVASAPREVVFHDLKMNPGPVGIESVRQEVAKFRVLEHLGLPPDLFNAMPAKGLAVYRQRAAAETLYELRRHPDATRYTLLAAFCWQRRQEILDNLVDLLLLIIHKIGARAEKRVDKTLLDDLKRVDGKSRLLYRLAEASLAKPDGTVRDVVYPVAGEQRLQDIVKEYKANGSAYREQVQTVMRASYRNHYRRMVPLLLTMLDIRSNNDLHRPVVHALAVVKRYMDSSVVYYPLEENIPLEDVVKAEWREVVEEKDAQGERRVNRINYELSVLQALREKVRCRELWIAGAGKYGNPDHDLPQDFDQQREAVLSSVETAPGCLQLYRDVAATDARGTHLVQ